MGGKVSITQEDITNIFTESVINVTQKDSMLTEEQISLYIDNTAVVTNLMENRLKCLQGGTSVDDCLKEFPESMTSVHDIAIEGVVNINALSSAGSTVSQEQQDKITDSITSKIKKESDIDIGTSTKSKISNIVNEQASVVTNILQQTDFKSKMSENVIIKGGGISAVTLKSVIDSVYNSLKNQSTFTSAMTDLTKDIKSEIDQKNSAISNLNKTITLIIVFIVVLFILLFIAITVMKKNKNKSLNKNV